MKTLLTIFAFTIIAASSCLALRLLPELVNKQRAKELGIELRTKANGANEVWVELEFKAEGELKAFDPEKDSHVSLGIKDGQKFLLGFTTLQAKQSGTSGYMVGFMANRAFLDQVALTIVIGGGKAPGGSYELRMKEFVDAGNAR